MNPPAGYGPTLVTLRWEAEGQYTELFVNGDPVSDFPGSITGSYRLEVEPIPTSIIDFNAVRAEMVTPAYSRAVGFFSAPTIEVEPNDDLDSTSLIDLYGVSGMIVPADDVDFFRIFQGTPLRIWTTPRTSTTCTMFPTLALYDDAGTELGRVSDRPTELGICAQIDSERHPFTAAVPRGSTSPYLISVSTDGDQSGEYILFVEANLIPR